MGKMSIAKIVLETRDDQVVNLTLTEARDLYQQLHELFGDKLAMRPYPIVIERERLPWQPYQPTWVVASTSTGDTPPKWPVVTCHSRGSGLVTHYSGPEQG